MSATPCLTSSIGNHHDDEYEAFITRINTRFLANCANGTVPVFTTDAGNLWDAYLSGFRDPAERQYHNCHACRHFIERFGALVTINEDGAADSAIWDEADAPPAYRDAVSLMMRAVRRAKVTGVFLSSDLTWGTPEAGAWRHFAIKPPTEMVFRRTIKTAEQAMAEKREDFKTVITALNEYNLPDLDTAVRILQSDALYRSEKVLGQGEWLRDLHKARTAATASRRQNVVWRAIATAPAGFCHPRSSMIGTLLDDIARGKGFDEVSRAFAAKMHPLRYQRPQAAPASGAIAAAEKIVQQLGAAGSLARRFARLDEVVALWRPAPAQPAQSVGGVFGHLTPKGTNTPQMDIPAQVMTWDKFRRTVLDGAERIQFMTPASGPYTALVTAVDPDAPPILQWDREEDRNPVSWYFWNGGSTAGQFGLPPRQFVDVDAVALQPSMWGDGCAHQGAGVVFILAGARETRQAGAALFPEILKADFHGIRSVIEAYSRAGRIEGMAEPHAAGVMLKSGASQWDCLLRVWVGGRHADYRLDRWD